MTGNIHSIETLGALDGPGIRCVAFLQGCPLRCQYCHNPDTWATRGGSALSPEELVARVRRYRPYFGLSGGLTLSGGEPLGQPQFAAEVLRLCRAEGIHTAVDTSGACSGPAALEALAEADLVILDLKHLDPRRYRELTGAELRHPLAVLDFVREQRVPLWVRQVVAEGWNDSVSEARALGELLADVPSLQRVELLPYHELAQGKWVALGLPAPARLWRPPAAGQVAELERVAREVSGCAVVAA